MRRFLFLSLLSALPAAAEPLPSDLQPHAKDLPVVTIKSARPVELEFLQDSQEIEVAGLGFPALSISAEKWRTVCEAPCSERVYRKGIFRITGEEVVTSADFGMPREGNRVTLYVQPGSRSVRRAGWATLATGSSLAVAGLLVVGLSPLQGQLDGYNPLLLAGGIGGGLGFSLLITSIPLLVKSRTLISADR